MAQTNTINQNGTTQEILISRVYLLFFFSWNLLTTRKNIENHQCCFCLFVFCQSCKWNSILVLRQWYHFATAWWKQFLFLVFFQLMNTIPIKSWSGEPQDRELQKLIPSMEKLSAAVRLSYYQLLLLPRLLVAVSPNHPAGTDGNFSSNHIFPFTFS